MRINWLGVIIAAILIAALRYLWSAHFGGADWMHMTGKAIHDIQANQKQAGMELGSALVLAIVLGWVIGLTRDRSIVTGIGIGIVTAVGFAGTTVAPEYIFGGAALKTFLIDAGYYLAAYVVAGAVLGAMAPKRSLRSSYRLNASEPAAEH